MRKAILAACVLAALAGCRDLGADVVAPADAGSPPVSFAADIQPIFDQHCTGCHGQDGSAGLDLRPGLSWANLAGVTATGIAMPRVDPGNPQNSWLYRKLTATQTVGEPMPYGGPPLPNETLDLVRQWILDEALNN